MAAVIPPQAGRVTPPQLVAVSKTQPVCKVQAAYQEGLRHFGENYVQELHSKATELQVRGRLVGSRSLIPRLPSHMCKKYSFLIPHVGAEPGNEARVVERCYGYITALVANYIIATMYCILEL